MEIRPIRFSIPSRIDSIDIAVSRAVGFAEDKGFDEQAVFGIDMAVREAVANAVKHGNKLDESKEVEIELEDAPRGLEIMVRDFGAGFKVEDVPDPTNPENLLKANGRGILFIQNFVDFVEWSNHPAGGMVVKMRKER
ncbi:MAG: ATP-binding protein [Pyrinomonadaceae bacterium]